MSAVKLNSIQTCLPSPAGRLDVCPYQIFHLFFSKNPGVRNIIPRRRHQKPAPLQAPGDLTTSKVYLSNDPGGPGFMDRSGGCGESRDLIVAIYPEHVF